MNALGYLRVMFTVSPDIDDTLARLGKRQAELVGKVVQYEETVSALLPSGAPKPSSGSPRSTQPTS